MPNDDRSQDNENLLRKLTNSDPNSLRDKIGKKDSIEPDPVEEARKNNAVNNILNKIEVGKSIVWLIKTMIRLTAVSYGILIIAFAIWLVFDFKELSSFLTVSYNELKSFASNNQSFLVTIGVLLFGRELFIKNQ